MFSASYDLDNIISVTGVSSDNRAGDTGFPGPWNYGLTSVDLGAPAPGGTSAASSHTSGVAALLKSLHPDWDYTQLKAQLMATVDPLSSLAGKCVTGGRINAAKALGVVYAAEYYIPNDAATDQTYEYDASDELIENYTLNTAPRGSAKRLSGSQNAASSFSLNTNNKNPKDIVTDGTSLWVVNSSTTDKVFRYTLAGSLLGSWTIDAANNSPTGITLDPTNVAHLWIVDNGTDRVYQYDNAASRTSGSQSASTSFALAAGNTNPQGIADPPAAGASSAVQPSKRRPSQADSVDYLLATDALTQSLKPRRHLKIG
jgi:hypothetical protein